MQKTLMGLIIENKIDQLTEFLQKNHVEQDILNWALFSAAEYGHWDMVNRLLDHGAEIRNYMDNDSAFIYACGIDELNTAWRMLQCKELKVYLSADWGSAFERTCARKNVPLAFVQAFLDHPSRKEDPTSAFADFLAGIEKASTVGNLPLVKYLLSRMQEELKSVASLNNFYLNTLYRIGLTEAIRCAQIKRRSEIIPYLLSNINIGGDVDRIYTYLPYIQSKVTALMLAAIHGDRHNLRFLLNRGAQIDLAEEVDGKTALMLAAQHLRANNVRLLLKYGADPSRVTLKNESVIDVLCQQGHFDEKTTKTVGYIFIHLLSYDAPLPTSLEKYRLLPNILQTILKCFLNLRTRGINFRPLARHLLINRAYDTLPLLQDRFQLFYRISSDLTLEEIKITGILATLLPAMSKCYLINEGFLSLPNEIGKIISSFLATVNLYPSSALLTMLALKKASIQLLHFSNTELASEAIITRKLAAKLEVCFSLIASNPWKARAVYKIMTQITLTHHSVQSTCQLMLERKNDSGKMHCHAILEELFTSLFTLFQPFSRPSTIARQTISSIFGASKICFFEPSCSTSQTENAGYFLQLFP